MEDTSYVSLSLEKYNELYDKAKKYDEIKFEKAVKNAKEYVETLENIYNDIFSNKEAAATEEIDDEIKVGDKVRLVDIRDKRFEEWFKVGDICKVVEISNDMYRLNKDVFLYSCEKSAINKVNESEEN